MPLGDWSLAGETTVVPLPEWANDIEVPDIGGLLVHRASLVPSGAKPTEQARWDQCDWLCAAWHHLTGSIERVHERQHGPTGSYALRMRDADPRAFDRAWANRIFLFLRRLAARRNERSEAELFGPLPQAEIVLTHDVDALSKTPEIRLKQTAFHAFNAARMLSQGKAQQAARRAATAVGFLTSSASFRTFDLVRKLEDRAGLRSRLHFYGGPPGLGRVTPGRILFDPAYDVLGLSDELRAFREGGWTVGLHQSTRAWRDEDAMRTERGRVGQALGADVTCCRQHWLKFSWRETWRAQEAAGLTLDSTLGFNDRPGFRNGAAIRMRPWDFDRDVAMQIETEPMVFMDSHFYDYSVLDEEARNDEMAGWIHEIASVRGQATVNWHTHTITDAYGWGEGYRQLIVLLERL